MTRKTALNTMQLMTQICTSSCHSKYYKSWWFFDPPHTFTKARLSNLNGSKGN